MRKEQITMAKAKILTKHLEGGNGDVEIIEAKVGEALIKNDTPWEYKKKFDSVCICGTAPTLANTPWEEKEFEFWACSPTITYPEVQNHRFDLLFELHPAEYFMQEAVRDRLNEYNAPIYMLEKNDVIKNSLAYPLKRIQGMVNNGYINKYFTSTISYMIAIAVCMGYKRIELWGCHMAAQEEWGDQRQACEAWLGYAAGLGIDFYIPGQSEIFRCPHLYGFEQENSMKIQARIRKEGLKMGIAQLEEEMKKLVIQQKALQSDIDKNTGAMIDSEFWERRYT
jgi:hypothetical protein